MLGTICIRVIWDRTAIPLPLKGFYSVHVGPEPGYPFGRRGLTLAGAWQQLSCAASLGMLMLDGDVAVDPCDVAIMMQAIGSNPDVVHVAPVKIWPVSTKRGQWVWAHSRDDNSQDDTDEPIGFGFSFTYLPRALIESCIEAGLRSWAYPWTDTNVSKQARELGTRICVVRNGCSPKHLNY
jgi:hypothetical protein